METLEQKLEKVNDVIKNYQHTINTCNEFLSKAEQEKLDLEKQIDESKKPKRERAENEG